MDDVKTAEDAERRQLIAWLKGRSWGDHSTEWLRRIVAVVKECKANIGKDGE
jgi:hypothetical protein